MSLRYAYSAEIDTCERRTFNHTILRRGGHIRLEGRSADAAEGSKTIGASSKLKYPSIPKRMAYLLRTDLVVASRPRIMPSPMGSRVVDPVAIDSVRIL